MIEITCEICGKSFGTINTRYLLLRGVTCSPECLERLVRLSEYKYGAVKKITRLSTGESFRVPVRDIIEKGIKEQELDQYPKWVD